MKVAIENVPEMEEQRRTEEEGRILGRSGEYEEGDAAVVAALEMGVGINEGGKGVENVMARAVRAVW